MASMGFAFGVACDVFDVDAKVYPRLIRYSTAMSAMICWLA